MIEARLYMLQRLSAVIMAPLVIVHLMTIFMPSVAGSLLRKFSAGHRGFLSGRFSM